MPVKITDVQKNREIIRVSGNFTTGELFTENYVFQKKRRFISHITVNMSGIRDNSNF